MTRERTGSTDHRDQRAGAYDGVNKAGTPQADQVGELLTPHQAMQPGADVRPEPATQPAQVLPKACDVRLKGRSTAGAAEATKKTR